MFACMNKMPSNYMKYQLFKYIYDHRIQFSYTSHLHFKSTLNREQYIY